MTTKSKPSADEIKRIVASCWSAVEWEEREKGVALVTSALDQAYAAGKQDGKAEMSAELSSVGYDGGYRAGFEAAKEKAAKIADETWGWPDGSHGIGTDIRALRSDVGGEE